MSDSVPRAHRHYAPDAVSCRVVTVSDSRTLADDQGGSLICSMLERAGHHVVGRAIVVDEVEAIRAAFHEGLRDEATDVVISTGGTGISSRDSTFEVVRSLLDKELTGFGELFRMLSFREIGAAAMLSRATAGVVGRTILIALPGSPGAVMLAMDQLLIPELAHLVGQARR